MSAQAVPLSAEHEKSYSLLNIARERQAKEEEGYSSTDFRRKVQDEFTRRFHKPAYEWQLDVGEALCLGLDSLVLAGTGEGKSFPWLFPLLNDSSGEKKILVISPLNALEEDLARRFAALGFPSVAINGETWNRALRMELEAGKHRVMLTSPEMALKHDGFRQLLSTPSFSKDIAIAVVDEAHCISQWGGAGGFREEYGEVGRLRAILPPTVPILATTATATPAVQHQIRNVLQFSDDLFFINRGNDRHNITPEVIRMTGGASDYSDLNCIIDNAQGGELDKTMVFCNSIQTTHDIANYLRARLPHLRKREIAVYHALRTSRAKKKVMRDFRNGKIRVLVTTEAAGMGADIPDVKLVVQFKVPASLSIWLQRAGRAARSPDILGRAILLVEKSVFETVKVTAKKPKAGGDRATDEMEPVLDDAGEDESEDGEPDSVLEHIPLATSVGSSGPRRYRKKVEEGLRAYIEATQCRRDISDKYFSNPPRIRELTVPCCDNCIKAHPMPSSTFPQSSTTASRSQPPPNSDESRPVTPNTELANDALASTQSTPSSESNDNGKRPMILSDEPKPKSIGARREKRLATVREALTKWRLETWRQDYSSASFGPSGLLPDTYLTKIASAASIATLDDLRQAFTPQWAFERVHGEEVLAVVKDADDRFKAEEERLRAKEREAKKENTNQTKVQREERRRQESFEQRKMKTLARGGHVAGVLSWAKPEYDSPPLVLQPSHSQNIQFVFEDPSQSSSSR